MTEIEAAQARIRESRERLLATLGQVQDRLRPSSLAQDAVDSAAQGMASVARRGARAVRRRPVATAAVTGLIGLVMARGWIADILGRKRETPPAPDSLQPKAKRAPRARKGTTR